MTRVNLRTGLRALVFATSLLTILACSEVKFAGTVAQPSVNKKGEVCVPNFQPCTTSGGLFGHTLNKVLPEGCPGSAPTLDEGAPVCEPFVYKRCEQSETLSPAEAQGLLDWVANCQSKIPELRDLWRLTHNGVDIGYASEGALGAAPLKGRVMFPVLRSKTNLEWRPPHLAAAACSVPGGLDEVDTLCSPGCYAPEQKLRVSADGLEQNIGEAESKAVRSVAVVKDSSVTNQLEIENSEVKYFISSAKDETEELYIIETSGGRTLRLTAGHPVVGADGEVHLAAHLEPGAELLRADGGVDRIMAVAKTEYFGKVHNVTPELKAGSGEFVVSEGIVQGSHRHQLDAAVLLNRQLFRNRLTEGLFN